MSRYGAGLWLFRRRVADRGPGRADANADNRHAAITLGPFPSRRLVYVFWSNTVRPVRFRQLQPISAPPPPLLSPLPEPKFKASTRLGRLLDDTHSNPRSIPPLSSAESNPDQIRCQNRWQELAQIPPVPIRFCCVAKFIGLRVSGTAESDTNNCTALLGVQIELPRVFLCLSSWSKFS